jgi:triosephosphate isomerase
MARKIVAGNWKMNLTLQEGVKLIDALNHKEVPEGVELMVFPSHLLVPEISRLSKGVEVGVQNFNEHPEGAYTGETSLDQVKSCGVEVALIGHSERRQIFNEGHEVLKMKVNHALAEAVRFVFCCGEPLEIREAGAENEYVKSQLQESLFHVPDVNMRDAVIAYEPVWAIGTGRTASAAQAEEMHANIRNWVAEVYGEDVAKAVTILYGGSCKPENAKELFAEPNVDGGLIGGASLSAESFIQIARSF